MAHPTSPAAVSNVRVMRALIAKDWRLFRLPIIGLIVAGVGAYLVAAGAASYVSTDLARYSHPTSHNHHSLEEASLFACFLTALLASTFGGSAIAGERNDRTADFIALLPVSRGQIVTSKILVAASILAVFGALYVLLADFWTTLQGLAGSDFSWAGLGCDIGAAVSFLGVAWLISTFATSATISACVSIGVTLGAIAWMTFRFRLNPHLHWSDAQVYVAVTCGLLAIGLSSLIAGTIYYLRRVAP